jgi:NitT/TauT family transport system substrate-binding protein
VVGPAVSMNEANNAATLGRPPESRMLRYFTAQCMWRLLIGMALAVWLLSPAEAAAEKIRIAAPTLTANSAFFIIALQKGYFADEGLEVEVVNAAGGISTPALVAGDLQFSLSTGASISAIVKGARLKVILVTQDRPGGEIWSTKPDIKSLDDLRGKQVAIQSRGDTGEIALRALLQQRGLPNDYLSFTPVGVGSGRFAALKAGVLPAVLLYWSEIEELRESDEFASAHAVVDLADQVRMVYNGLVTSDKVIKNRPDLIAKVVRAALKGVAYARAFRNESIKLVASYSKLPLQGTAFEFDKMLRTARPDDTIDVALQTSEIARRAALLGVQQSEIPANSTVFDFSFVDRERLVLKASGWKPQP